MTSPHALLYDCYYHIYNRGNNRENIFVEERNYVHFLKLYVKYIDPVAETFAYSLLRNHFHVLVRIKSEDEISLPNKTGKPIGPGFASQQFSNFFNAYAKSINKAYNRTGSLFQHPFGRVAVTSDRQFFNAVRYIHQNPQKHQFVTDFRDWKWSSYESLVSDRPTHLGRETVLEWFRTRQEYLQLHAEWVLDAQMRWFADDDHD